jgi:Raf kinase inhibitor-like YbhB/YbcL family protein
MLEKLPEFVGHALRDARAGIDQVLSRRLAPGPGTGAITLSSPDFVDHGPLPERCTADGEGTSPALHWRDVPAGAASVVLLVEDADAPAPHPLVHAIVVDLPGEDGGLDAGSLDDELALPPPGRLGKNSWLGVKWLPPDPPPGHGSHRYVFQVFALAAGDSTFPDHAGRDAVADAVAERAIASGWIVGTYARPDGRVKDTEGAPPLAAA